MENTPAALVVNLQADRGARLYSAAVASLRRRGIRLTAAYPVGEPDQLRTIVARLIAQGQERIVVGGGDGTLSSIVGCFVGHDAVLGVLPLGTGNSFARSLGIPLDLEGAVDVIANGRVKAVDLGRVGDRYFADAVAIGFTAVTGHPTSEFLKRHCGVAAYVISGIRRFLASRPFRCTLCWPGGQIALRTYLVVVANGGYFGTRRLDPDATVEDGQLVIATVDTLDRWKLVRLAWDYAVGGHAHLPDLRCWNASGVTIDAEPPQHLNVDGKIQGQTPARFTLVPRALQVILPR